MLQVSPQDSHAASPARSSRLTPPAEPPIAAGMTDPSEWSQHAAHMQQAAHLLGLHRLFASRSTPHLPDLDPTFVGHDFDSPPPYAPQASAIESELESAFAGQATSTAPLASGEPPLPPPISIPGLTGDERRIDVNGHLSNVRRSSFRPGPSPRGSRSGPPSPSASFYGRRGLTSLSPLPAGLEMTPNVVYNPQFSAPGSPNIAPDSDPEDDREDALSFSSSQSRRQRDDRRASIASIGNGRLNDVTAQPLPSRTDPALCSSGRRRAYSGSARMANQPATTSNADIARTLPPSSARYEPNNNEASRFSRSDSGSHGGSQQQHEASSEGPSSPEIGADESEPASPISADTTASADDFGTGTESARLAQAGIKSTSDYEEDSDEFPLVLKMMLHTLRILAVVPGCIGTFWLMRNAVMLARVQHSLLGAGQTLILTNGTIVYPSPSGLHDLEHLHGSFRLGRRQPGALDFAVSCLWSMSTAYHALSFTTLLLRRWLLYYSILPSLIRLVALQAICWPLVRLTVFLFGPDQPLGAWVVIGTTTAFSDVVSRWVTSNIADAPLEGEPDDDDDEWEDEALNSASDVPFGLYGRVKISAETSGRYLYGNRRDYGMDRASGANDSDWDARSGDESEAMAAIHQSLRERSERRRQRRGGQGTRFWRAVIGGPTTPSKRKQRRHEAPNGQPSYLSGTATETEFEAESDWAGYGTDRTLMGSPTAALRRRRATTSQLPQLSSENLINNSSRIRVQTSIRNPHGGQTAPKTTFEQSSSLPVSDRADSRRRFRWDVAMRRNVLPVAGLGYLSMWILILDAMKFSI